MFHISSYGGRIGPFWWVNSNTQLQTYQLSPGLKCRIWQPGSCGWGGDPHFTVAVYSDPTEIPEVVSQILDCGFQSCS